MSLPFSDKITSPGSRPALAAGSPFSTELTSAPAGLLIPERIGEGLVKLLNRDAQTTALHLAVLHDLLFDIHRNLDWNGEGEPLITARAAVNLRIDADHFTGHIEQRAARITRI